MTPQLEWTVLAHLLRPQGRKGELLAELHTDFPTRFAEGSRVFLAKPGFTGAEPEARAITIANHWLPVGKNQGRIVLHFAGIDSIEQAETFMGLDVLIPDEERLELDDDAEYISDLVDCEVYDGARLVGTVTGVDFPTTPDGGRRLEGAPPLLTVETDGGDEVLIPFVQAFLVEMDIPGKRIEMRLPEGLLEVNRGSAREEEPESEA